MIRKDRAEHQSPARGIKGKGRRLRAWWLPLLDEGLTSFPLQPLRLSLFAKLGPTWTWGLITVLVYAPFFCLMARSWRDPVLRAAMTIAAIGIFLCNWLAVLGLKILLDTESLIESIVDHEAPGMRDEFLARIRGGCSLGKTTVGGLAAGVLITSCLYLQNESNPATLLARSFAALHGACYALIFFSAFAIGVGHVCILCALRVMGIVRSFGLRKLFSTVRVNRLSQSYLYLASFCFLVYINYLSYLYVIWLGGVRFSPLVNGLIAVVGAVVLLIYTWPHLVIHIELKKNKEKLLEEAIGQLEEIVYGGEPLSREQRTMLVAALDYLARVQALPTWGFKAHELIAVVFGYAFPLITFIEVQGSRLLSLL